MLWCTLLLQWGVDLPRMSALLSMLWCTLLLQWRVDLPRMSAPVKDAMMYPSVTVTCRPAKDECPCWGCYDVLFCYCDVSTCQGQAHCWRCYYAPFCYSDVSTCQGRVPLLRMLWCTLLLQWRVDLPRTSALLRMLWWTLLLVQVVPSYQFWCQHVLALVVIPVSFTQ